MDRRNFIAGSAAAATATLLNTLCDAQEQDGKEIDLDISAQAVPSRKQCVLLWKVGSADRPASEKDIEKVINSLKGVDWGDGVEHLVGHHMLDVQAVTPNIEVERIKMLVQLHLTGIISKEVLVKEIGL